MTKEIFKEKWKRKKFRWPRITKYNIWPFTFMIVVILILLWCTLGMSIVKVSNKQTYTVTVQSKEVKNDEDNSKYLVFTIDTKTGESRVFEITDSLWKGRFNSSDVYNMILPDHTYTFTTGGYRVPFLSWYQNIYEVTEIEKEN